jgi:hypothetical protein
MEPSQPNDVSLQFDKAELGSDGDGLVCELCQLPIADTYYEVSGRTACESCRHEVELARSEGSSTGRLFRAILAGGAGGLLGAGIYYAVLALTGYEIGLVAIVVGLLVGFGVRWGSGGVGGRGYQLLAVAITYVAIVSTYIPFIIEGFQEAAQEEAAEGGTPGGAEAVATEEALEAETEMEASLGMLVFALGALLLLAMASPFLAGVQNAIGILIIGFALYEAWRVTAYHPLVVEGPFRLGAGTTPPAAT